MSDIKKSGRGGRRAGAGRKTVDKVELVADASVGMDQQTYDVVMLLGNGNAGLGVRRAVAELIELRAAGVATGAARGERGAAATGRAGAAQSTTPKARPVYKEPARVNADGTRVSIARYLQLERQALEKYQRDLADYEKADCN